MKTDSSKIDLHKHLSVCRQSFKRAEPSWLTDFRQKSWDEFSARGIPTLRDEDWKYTDLAPLSLHSFSLPVRPSSPQGINSSSVPLSPDEIVFFLINGFVFPSANPGSALPPGLEAISSGNIGRDEYQPSETALTNVLPLKENPFVLLNDVFWQDYLKIKISDKTIIPQLIHLVSVAQNTDDPIFSNPRISISVGRFAQASIMLTFLSAELEPITWTNAVIDIHLKEGSVCHLIESQIENPRSFHFGTLRVRQDRDSAFHSCLITTGGALTRNDLLIELQGEGASTDLRGIYSITDQQLVDNHTHVKHLYPHGTSNQLYKGVLAHAAHAVFNGKITVSPSAQGTNSYQLNKNLLMGKKSLVHTKPQLEIFTDDVKCTHGATIGQLNEEEIIYLQMRGIARKEAIRMLTEGFVIDVIDTITMTEVQKQLRENLLPTINAAVAGED